MVPGNLAEYWAMHQAHGRHESVILCDHAIKAAETGWMVCPHFYSDATQDEGAQWQVHNYDILGFTVAGPALYIAETGAMHRPGTIIQSPGLMASLPVIADEGAAALYGGAIGETLVADMQANGGLITMADLEAYQASRAPALTGTYRRIGNGEKAVLNRMAQPKESTETTHIVVFDRDAFSMTHTLGAPSGFMPPACGFILNGCISIFEPRPR